ncbi:heavy-metal-associated domain-containing protein [Lachnoclostridium sp. Marseille-P6806]|uniref:heavy-metal-associated domain-containing protein n=1 Tax=Lachnoclostridium sp. Marseille-P6806 TaxID=2364793 RepID=UPI0013EEF4C6|nr:heavy-metal-associated domain-containing protein [Lachnoclostridium sp. Marseille-P6806]
MAQAAGSVQASDKSSSSDSAQQCPVERSPQASAAGSEQPAPQLRIPAGAHTGTVTVKGLMCHNCERHVSTALKKIPDIADAVADFTIEEVRIAYTSEPDEQGRSGGGDQQGRR